MCIKLSCADFTFPLADHDTVLKIISMLGFAGVDIGLFENRSHLQPSAVFSDISKHAGKLKHRCEENGLEIADIFLQCADDFETMAINHPNADIRKKVRRQFLLALEFAQKCGAKHVTFLPGIYFGGENMESSYKRACEELAWRCEASREYGLPVSVEAHVGSIAGTPKEAMKLLMDVPLLSLTLDYSHFIKEGFSNEEIRPLNKYARHFHARGTAKNILQCSFSKNEADFSGAVDVLAASNYKGYIAAEYVWTEWEKCNEVDNLSETILLKNYLDDIVGKKKKLFLSPHI